MTCPRRPGRASSKARRHAPRRLCRPPLPTRRYRPRPSTAPPSPRARLASRRAAAYNGLRNERIKHGLPPAAGLVVLLAWSWRFAIPPVPEDLEDLEPTTEEWATAVRLAELILDEMERRQQPGAGEEGE